MEDETSRAVALWVKYGRIEAILLSSRYAARHTLLTCCCIDSVWSRWTPRFLTEDLYALATYVCTISANRTKAGGRWNWKNFGVSVHLVWACCCTSSLQDCQCRSGYHREETEIDREEPPLTTGYHQRICDNHTHGDISSQRGAGNTMLTGLAQEPNPAEPRAEVGWERARRCQP